MDSTILIKLLELWKKNFYMSELISNKTTFDCKFSFKINEFVFGNIKFLFYYTIKIYIS